MTCTALPADSEALLAAVDAYNADYLADADYVAERAAGTPAIRVSVLCDRDNTHRVIVTPGLIDAAGGMTIAAEPILAGIGLRPFAPAAGGTARMVRTAIARLVAGTTVPVLPYVTR